MFKFRPENELERSLVRATVNPAHRPAFYRDFARATVYVVPHGSLPVREGKAVLTKGSRLTIAPVKVDGRTYLPVFSSVKQLSAAVRGDVRYLGITAREFLKVVSGAELILNPGSGFGKIFTREEIATVLAEAGDGRRGAAESGSR
jgi:hypothetical protein